MSIVINELESRARAAPSQICLAYFYMRYSNQSLITVRAVLEVLVKQSIERHDALAAIAEQTYARHLREQTQPSERELLRLLTAFAARIPFTFYFLDALDEAPVDVQHDLVDKLMSTGACIFITSRPMNDVQASFPEAYSFEVTAREEDLDIHITKRLHSSPRLCALLARGDAALRERVVSTIKSCCRGMFLHATLQLDALQRCVNPRQVIQTLEHFPAKIEEVYHQTWERILNQDAENVAIVKAALVWVLHAHGTLSVEALCRAIATCPVSYQLEHECLIAKSTIVDLCQGLLIVDEGSELVRLVHYTAREPLTRLLKGDYPEPHILLAAVCVTHLTKCGLQNVEFRTREPLLELCKNDPLLAYAYEAWMEHTRRSLDQSAIASLIKTFISSCRSFPVITTAFYTHFELLTPLHVAAFYDFPIAFAGPEALKEPNLLTERRGRTPLHLACAQGHYTVAQGLVGLPDISLNAMDYQGSTALMLASMNGYEVLVHLLLQQPGIQVQLALVLACEHGHENVVKLLLAHPSTNVNAASRNNSGWTALMRASWKGHEHIVRLLLTCSDIEVNLVDADGSTALMLAAWEGHQGIVRLLLSHPDAAIHIANDTGSTALSLASTYGHTHVVELLLQIPHIDVNPRGKHGDIAIKMAAERGHENIVRMLLKVPGIDISMSSNQDGHTAMSAAVENGHNSIVQLLEEFVAQSLAVTHRRGAVNITYSQESLQYFPEYTPIPFL